MKKRFLELLIVYLVYFTTLLICIQFMHLSVRIALTSAIIWLMPFIAILPAHFIAFIITIGWPNSNDKTDTYIYRITHLLIYSTILLIGCCYK
ncbi:hypothetical protein ACDQ55_02860 [Chitinophaga sp. 30R24]|uniref:hypothetical protein n=1 Tax=Chitinophaga sp. 30R24 TaxID=3248838 RepID=UPI003B900243